MMPEPWMIGLGIAALLVLWVFWTALEEAVVGGVVALTFGAVHDWWKSRQK